MPTFFRDRSDAGKILAFELRRFAHRPDIIVLALPRGGIPVAFEVAQSLGVPLDVLLVRKLGVPGHEELAMGAVASGGAVVINEQVVHALMISPDKVKAAIEREMREIKRGEELYRGDEVSAEVSGKTVVIVDDGIATGATLRAGIQALRRKGPAHLVVAVPVAPRSACRRFAGIVDQLIVLATPDDFLAVGQAYENFEPVSDSEVRRYLLESRAHA